MSINHFSQDVQETPWWSSQYPPPQKLAAHHHHQACLSYPYHSHSLSFNLNRGGDDDESSELGEQVIDFNGEQQVPDLEKEMLFQKPLTPSDVGKLNRLVIPKQHAERYFPLGGQLGDKGLLLSFEDESGKCWRFRYSYWSSSQSYVLTRGWSRYVKEKRLDAGDVVLFQRHRTDIRRVFIGWRRRVEGDGAAPNPRGWAGTTATSANKRGIRHSYPSQPGNYGPSTVTDCSLPGSAVNNQTAVTGNSKTLRLFGVNMECQPDVSDPSTPDGCSSLSSLGLSHQPVYSQSSSSHYYVPNFHQMDITFTQDVDYHQQQLRNRRG